MLGLTVDNQYESGYIVGSPELYSKGLYANWNGPSIMDGINIIDTGVGFAGIGGDYKYFEWELDALSGDAALGFNKKYIGAELKASLIGVEGGFKLPLPFTKKNLYIGGEGSLGSVGVHAYFDSDEGKIKIGVAAFAGVGLALGIVD